MKHGPGSRTEVLLHDSGYRSRSAAAQDFVVAQGFSPGSMDPEAGLTASAKATASPPTLRAKAEVLLHDSGYRFKERRVQGFVVAQDFPGLPAPSAVEGSLPKAVLRTWRSSSVRGAGLSSWRRTLVLRGRSS